MFTTISYTRGIALLSLLLCFPARAQNVEVGTGIFCGTRKQAERFVALYAERAMKAVNAEEKHAGACVGGTIAFIRGPKRGAHGSFWPTLLSRICCTCSRQRYRPSLHRTPCAGKIG
jgi:hypothetical protein